jgi:ATP-dependent DNA helicase RecG
MLPKEESISVEFKSDLKKLPDAVIFEAVVALANTDGGELYLGIEKDGSLTGVHKDHSNPVTLSAFISNNTVPPISVTVEVISNCGVQVLRIKVPKYSGGIVATASGKVMRRRVKIDGSPESVPMYPVEMQSRLTFLRLVDYSALPLQSATLADFNPVEVERLRNCIQTYEGERPLLELQDDDLFKALGFVREIDGCLVPTITGLLMVGRRQSIKRHVPTHSFSFHVMAGSTVKMNEDAVMPLLDSFEKLTTYIEARNQEQELELGNYRLSVPDFSRRAVREALVNAFSHRDYAAMGRVRVAFSNEGLTISNPGSFIEGLTVQNLLTAEPHGRNPLLADTLKRIGLAERTGRGIDRIFEASLLFGRLLPDYSNSTTVTVSLFIPRSAPDLQLTRIIYEEQNRLGQPLSINSLLVLNALRDAPKSTTTQLSEITNLPINLVRSVLDVLVASGVVEFIANRKGRSYSLALQVYQKGTTYLGYERQKPLVGTSYLELVVELATTKEYISRMDVATLLSIDPNSAYRVLKRLAEDGKLELVQKGRYAKYRMRE